MDVKEYQQMWCQLERDILALVRRFEDAAPESWVDKIHVGRMNITLADGKRAKTEADQVTVDLHMARGEYKNWQVEEVR